nr:agmatine deiminase family protein [Candidatus Fermentibacter daniensis]
MRFSLVILTAFMAFTASAEMSVCGTEELLPIGFTEEELLRLDEIGTYYSATPPPGEGVRSPGEFEPMTGVFIRWPLGVPYSVVVDFSNHTQVWVICLSSEQAAVTSAFTAQGVNMANVSFVNAPTNSIWVRDYGPWFLMLEDGTSGIFDFDYNRPRPDDDGFPIALGSAWGMPVYSSDIIQTGGNYMSTGFGISMSTDLVIDENGGDEDWVDSQMLLYCGVDDYFTPVDPQESYIDHIDCWGKLLSPDRILILQVPPSHQDYAALEAMADLIEGMAGPFG